MEDSYDRETTQLKQMTEHFFSLLMSVSNQHKVVIPNESEISDETSIKAACKTHIMSEIE